MLNMTEYSSNYTDLLEELKLDDPDEISEAIDDYNLAKYRTNHRDYVEIFICKCCKRNVSEVDSYSDQGQFLHCSACVTDKARESTVSTTKWLHDNIWIR